MGAYDLVIGDLPISINLPFTYLVTQRCPPTGIVLYARSFYRPARNADDSPQVNTYLYGLVTYQFIVYRNTSK